MTNNFDDKLDGSFTAGRIKRYAKVTSAVGGLAAKLAGEKYLGLKIDKENHAKQLREALGGIKGPIMKIAQILSTIPDAVPKEYANELAPELDDNMKGLMDGEIDAILVQAIKDLSAKIDLLEDRIATLEG